MIKLIKKADYVQMPWKNGQGLTAQIDIFPADAVFPGNDFLWRLSSATVHAASPFSQFPGCDRYLSILKGDGLFLNKKILGSKEIYYFHGEEEIHGKLINNTVLDLGLIFRRDSVRATMTFEHIPAGQTREWILDYDVNYIYCDQGSFKTPFHTVLEGDCLKITDVKNIELNADIQKDLNFILIQVTLIK